MSKKKERKPSHIENKVKDANDSIDGIDKNLEESKTVSRPSRYLGQQSSVSDVRAKLGDFVLIAGKIRFLTESGRIQVN